MNMHVQRTKAAIAAAVMLNMAIASSVLAAPAAAPPEAQPQAISAGGPLILALSPEQAKACEREWQALQQQLNQCGSNEQCRRSVQAAIDAHNARCR